MVSQCTISPGDKAMQCDAMRCNVMQCTAALVMPRSISNTPKQLCILISHALLATRCVSGWGLCSLVLHCHQQTINSVLHVTSCESQHIACSCVSQMKTTLNTVVWLSSNADDKKPRMFCHQWAAADAKLWTQYCECCSRWWQNVLIAGFDCRQMQSLICSRQAADWSQ